MLVLLFLCSAICIVAGAAMVAFGIPVKEFSFGDTLIAGGVTAIVGGLVVGAIGIAVLQLQRIMDALAARPIRAGRLPETFEPRAAGDAHAGEIPFPVRPRAERQPGKAAISAADAPKVADFSAEESVSAFPPTLPNPDQNSVIEESGTASPSHEASAPPLAHDPLHILSETKQAPEQPQSGPVPDPQQKQTNDVNAAEDRRRATSPVRPSQSSFFDTLRSANRQAGKATPREESAPPAPESSSAKPSTPAHGSAPNAAAGPTTGERRTVAILKSGVVDGMAYTLYVDGSIEAELPDGKLRFASINELRSYLEQHS